MADIKAFHAMRYTPKAGDPKALTCPPYDIISEEQRKAYLEQNEHNVIRLELPKGDDPYNTAGETLRTWLSDGTLKCDEDAGIYIYEEEFLTAVDHGEKKSLKGIVSLVRVEDFSAGVVLPHEETLSKAKKDRFELMKATNCNFSQIYSLYVDENGETQRRIERLSQGTPRYEFSDGLVTHRLWVVNDKMALEAFRAEFASRKLYIADGHHRYETAINYRNYCRENAVWAPGSEFVMMMLVDMAHPGLVVFPTHRLVRDFENFDAEKVLIGCVNYFDVAQLSGAEAIEPTLKSDYDAGKKSFVFVYSKDGAPAYALLTLKDLSVMAELLPEKSAASRELDVSVLHTLVLERILGIDKENMANQKNLTYTRSLDEALTSVADGESQCAFILNPTRVEEIGAVAAAGEKMPQKSTYFYPKLITGLVMNNLEAPIED
ncbi:MAG: DUF1015 domain-containing protein [Clostridia bacterium]|nr:DUF1015 domain-containing protein [Clostridia bacterium]